MVSYCDSRDAESGRQLVLPHYLVRLRVPAVYLTWTNVLFLTFLAFSEINKLRVISRGQNPTPPASTTLSFSLVVS
jgi:hypothetical protein